MFESPELSSAKASRNRALMIIGLAVVVFVAIIATVLFYLSQHRAVQQASATMPYRAGSPQFESYKRFIEIEQREPEAASNLLGQVQAVARAYVRNRGNRTIVLLELRGVAYDADGNEIAYRLARPIPKLRPQLAPGESMAVQVNIDTIPAGANPYAARVELNGLRLKESEP